MSPLSSINRSSIKPSCSTALLTVLSRCVNNTAVAITLYIAGMGLLIYLAAQGANAMGYNWQWYRIPDYFYQIDEHGLIIGEIPLGLMATLKLSALCFVLAIGLGIVIALLRHAQLSSGRLIATCYLELIRNTPLLVLLYLFYYVLGPVLQLDRYSASVLCLGCYHAALLSEIFRAGINSVDSGQSEAAHAIGLNKIQTYRFIILPQAVKLVIPPLVNELIHVIKNTAILSVIAVAELTTLGRDLISDTYMSFEIWFTIAGVYLLVTLLLSLLASQLEKWYAPKK